MVFKPALLVVDTQNDYCSRPRGVFPVFGNGMDLVAPIKQLLFMPGFAMRITTLSEIPDNHKAMAHNNNGAKLGDPCIDLPNTKKGMGHKTAKQVALMKCCMEKTWGAQLVDGLQESDFDLVLRRNMHPDIWAWSALKDVHAGTKNTSYIRTPYPTT